jgi:hypothetical protein
VTIAKDGFTAKSGMNAGALNEKALRGEGLTLPLFAQKGHIRLSAIHLAQKGQVGEGINPTLNACN